MVRNLIAIAVLVGLAVAVFFALREKPEGEREEARRAIAPVPADRIDRIEIHRHSTSQDPIDDEFITLERRGALWQMRKPVDYPVNSNAVTAMVERLAALAPVDVISENEAKHAVLEVDDALGIGVKAYGGGALLLDVIVGVSKGDMTMVRRPGEDAVYRVQGAFRGVFNRPAKNLRDHAVTKVDKGSVTRVKVFHQGNELEIVKKGEEGGVARFEPVGAPIENFDWRKAAGLANGAAGIMTRDFQDAPVPEEISGLGEGATRVEFDAARDGLKGTFRLWIGKDVEKDRLTYVKCSQSEQLFLVPTHVVARFRTKAEDYARTDEQVAEQEKSRKAAEEHAQMHRDHADAAKAAEATGQSIPPEILKQLQEKMKDQPPAGEHGNH